jgi:hypothetical protein
MTAPWLTRRRWQCLQAFRRQPRLMDRAFLANELRIQHRNSDTYRPAAGATMDSLRDAGWVQQVIIGPDDSLGFRLGRAPRMWQLTDAGREAVKNCPDTFPGKPVYGNKDRAG